MIPITKPFLPPREEYDQLIDGVWQRNWLTNEGPLASKLEIELKKELEQEHLLFVSNGTIALQLGIRALEWSGEIITTPFSYVATSSSLVWEKCIPVYADIDPASLNIDPANVEALITEHTRGILATHVYGNPCQVLALEAIARQYGLTILYDGAHAFGVRYQNKSIFSYGHISTCSFHATKLFHTVEGGAVMSASAEISRKVYLSRSFGHTSATTFDGVGINGKNSEMHAAIGLCNLPYISEIIARRRALSNHYDSLLQNLEYRKQVIAQDTIYNYAYYPIILPNEQMVTRIIYALNLELIYPRRYFYPSLSSLDYVAGQHTPIADDISRRILCLPLYHNLSFEEVEKVCRAILREQKYGC